MTDTGRVKRQKHAIYTWLQRGGNHSKQRRHPWAAAAMRSCFLNARMSGEEKIIPTMDLLASESEIHFTLSTWKWILRRNGNYSLNVATVLCHQRYIRAPGGKIQIQSWIRCFTPSHELYAVSKHQSRTKHDWRWRKGLITSNHNNYLGEYICPQSYRV